MVPSYPLVVVQRAGGVWVLPVTLVPPTGARESDGQPARQGPLIEVSTAGMTSPIGYRQMFPERLTQMRRRGGMVRPVKCRGLVPGFATQTVWPRR